MKCDNCNKPATVHLTEISNGKKIEKHMCEQCAAQNEGLPIKTHTPINELLTNFVMAHSGGQLTKETALECPHCGMSWADFRQGGMLGCSHDYEAFESQLTPLIQRAHEGHAHHTGKSPARRGVASGVAKPKVDVIKVKKELAKAVEVEDYEKAAKLRDQLRKLEG